MHEHYYTASPTSQIREKSFVCSIRGITLVLTSASGVFAFGEKIDKASRILIENFSPTGNAVLDLGCGYGAIGLFIKTIFPEQTICMSDINGRAVDYAMLNAGKNGIDVSVKKSDLFSEFPGARFDDIVSNPPIAAGKKQNADLISMSYEHLNLNGSLWLVAYHNKGGSALKKIMEQRFGNVEDICKSGGIRVYRSRRGF